VSNDVSIEKKPRGSTSYSGPFSHNLPEFGSVGFEGSVLEDYSSSPSAFGRLPRAPTGWPDGCKGLAGLRNRDRIAPLCDIIEVRKALCSKLGHNCLPDVSRLYYTPDPLVCLGRQPLHKLR